ncbi:MAG TPA: serpin family protein [Candidatus Acidoferrales bacterium]|nr:serpin family protein [Candidatus Acidoferrales bacterium]
MNGRLLASVFALAMFAEPAAAAPAGSPDLGGAYSSFGFALLAKVRAEHPADNVFVSPVSVALALAMTAVGAGGTTRAAILKTLGASDTPMASFENANASLLASLADHGKDLQLSVANAIWLNQKFAIEPQFVSATHDAFGASAENLAFGQPAAAQTINDWVKTHTSGLIPAIVGSTDASEAAILTNAVAMKAKWAQQFKKDSTHDAPFHPSQGAPVTVSMMAQTANFKYASADGWQMARLPYCCDDRFAMYVVLPSPGHDPGATLTALSGGAFDRAIASLSEQRMLFEMPRYTATFQTRLNDPLAQMGMGVAFGDAADFSHLVAPPARAAISDVNHRVFVRVDEEGTQAAAATSVGITMMALPAPPPVRMIVDRPFVMAIRDDRTRQLLFLGVVTSPK